MPLKVFPRFFIHLDTGLSRSLAAARLSCIETPASEVGLVTKLLCRLGRGLAPGNARGNSSGGCRDDPRGALQLGQTALTSSSNDVFVALVSL